MIGHEPGRRPSRLAGCVGSRLRATVRGYSSASLRSLPQNTKPAGLRRALFVVPANRYDIIPSTGIAGASASGR
jgi:hypothetical protein